MKYTKPCCKSSRLHMPFILHFLVGASISIPCSAPDGSGAGGAGAHRLRLRHRCRTIAGNVCDACHLSSRRQRWHCSALSAGSSRASRWSGDLDRPTPPAATAYGHRLRAPPTVSGDQPAPPHRHKSKLARKLARGRLISGRLLPGRMECLCAPQPVSATAVNSLLNPLTSPCPCSDAPLVETPRDPPHPDSRDAERETSRDAERETSRDAERETSRDAERETPVAGRSVGSARWTSIHSRKYVTAAEVWDELESIRTEITVSTSLIELPSISVA